MQLTATEWMIVGLLLLLNMAFQRVSDLNRRVDQLERQNKAMRTALAEEDILFVGEHPTTPLDRISYWLN